MSFSRPVPGAWQTFLEAAWSAFVLVLMLLILQGSARGQSLVAVHADGTRAVDKAADVARPIASVTKVMTALLVAESGVDESAAVTIARGERSRRLRAGQRTTVGDLMTMMLLASDNAAAHALARTTGGTVQKFVAGMNQRAAALGLGSTRYADPAGLLATNVSTAYEQARLLVTASGVEAIGRRMRTAAATVRLGRRDVALHNTNRLLLDPELEVVAGKTGTTSKAGYCLATVLRAPSGEDVAIVVLGARRPSARFTMAEDAFRAALGG